MTLENYNLNAGMGTHTIKVTFQTGNYKGYVTYQMGGNMKGLNVLDNDEDSLYHHDYKDNPVKLKGLDDDDDWFSMSLINADGEVLLIEEEWDYIVNYVVGIEIIDFEREY